MRTRRWFVGSLIAAVLVLGVTGGAVLAQEVSDPDGGLSFAARVAGILGLDETQIQAALDQASTEIRSERLDRNLDGLVESGRLTQEQADEYREWVQSRPEGLSPRLGHGGHGSDPSQAPPPEGTSL